jgi:hypothetical protein
MHQLLLDRRLGQILRDNRVFEVAVFLGCLEGLDYGFGREAVTESITPRVLFSSRGLRAGALEGVEAVRFKLSERSRGTSVAAAVTWDPPIM